MVFLIEVKMLIVKYLMLSISLFLFHQTIGQNMIQNGDFEQYEDCPHSFLSERKFLPFWYSPTKGTPDYFNKCSKGSAGIPKNFAGFMKPKSGNGYAGIGIANLTHYLFGLDSHYSREYISTKLKEPLNKNELYCISFFVSLADDSAISIKQIGVYFSKQKIYKLFKKDNLKYDPQVKYISEFIDNTRQWVMISGLYMAQGGEKYLTIGNFQNDKELKWKKVKIHAQRRSPASSGGYYYIDKVELRPIEDNLSKCNRREFTY